MGVIATAKVTHRKLASCLGLSTGEREACSTRDMSRVPPSPFSVRTRAEQSGVVEMQLPPPNATTARRSNHAPRIKQGVKRRQHASQPMHSSWRITLSLLNFAQNQEPRIDCRHGPPAARTQSPSQALDGGPFRALCSWSAPGRPSPPCVVGTVCCWGKRRRG